MIDMHEFYQKYCWFCGSQHCTGEGEWLESCEHYQKEKENNNYLCECTSVGRRHD